MFIKHFNVMNYIFDAIYDVKKGFEIRSGT